MDLIVVFALFVFMLALLCFCVATVFSLTKDLYNVLWVTCVVAAGVQKARASVQSVYEPSVRHFLMFHVDDDHS